MHRFYVIILFLACFPAVWAEETPTQTREEKLIDIEIGTLTATNDTQPSDLLITVKTNKQSYYLLQSFGPFGMTEGAALNLASIIAKGKSIAEQGGAACFVLHLLF